MFVLSRCHENPYVNIPYSDQLHTTLQSWSPNMLESYNAGVSLVDHLDSQVHAIIHPYSVMYQLSLIP